VSDARVSFELSIVMPCLNEARSVARCVSKAVGFFERVGVAGEVIVADNGSTDDSCHIAEQAGARVVTAPRHGYGEALRAGVQAARGRLVVMGDSDNTYDFGALGPFLERLRAGDDLVVGNRFRGGIEPGAMPFLHRHIGNPVLTRLARLFFGAPIGDVYCGLRGFSKGAFQRMDLQSAGMEFALEMIIKATSLRLRVSEVPVVLGRPEPGRLPHLRPWKDGRRSLLLYLASIPGGLFLRPGVALMLGGMVLGALLTIGPVPLGPLSLDIHTLLYCSGAVTIGFQLVTYSIFLRFHMVTARLLPPDPAFARQIAAMRIELGLFIGGTLVLAGIAASLLALSVWSEHAFRALDPFVVMRIAIPAATALILGVQVVAASLYLSLLKGHLRIRESA
jgi:hypothetical protein